MGVLVQILQGGQLVGVLVNVGLEMALKIKALFQALGPDVQVNIKQIGDQTIDVNDETIAAVNADLVAQGLPPLQLQQPVEAPAPASSGKITGETPAPTPSK